MTVRIAVKLYPFNRKNKRCDYSIMIRVTIKKVFYPNETGVSTDIGFVLQPTSLLNMILETRNVEMPIR